MLPSSYNTGGSNPIAEYAIVQIVQLANPVPKKPPAQKPAQKKPAPYHPTKMECEKRALANFPTTEHIDAGAGYVLTDGTMLHIGADDHRIINVVFDRLPDGYKVDAGSSSYHMLAFMDIARALRVRRTTSGLFVDLIHPATRQQVLSVLETSAREVHVTWLTKDYETLRSEEFHLPESGEWLAEHLRGIF